MSRSRTSWTGWVLVTIGGITVALATLEAAAGASAANGAWQEAVRAQTAWTAATLSNTRKVYVDEAPLALSLNAGLIRAEELDRRRDPSLRAEAAAERATTERYLREFRAARGPINDLVATDRYQPGSGAGAPQLGRRLADLQMENVPLAAAVRDHLAEADRAGHRVTRGVQGILAGVAVALAGFVLSWWRTCRSAGAATPEPQPTPSASPTAAPPAAASPAAASPAAASPAATSPTGASPAAAPLAGASPAAGSIAGASTVGASPAGSSWSAGSPATIGALIPLVLAAAGAVVLGVRDRKRHLAGLCTGAIFGFSLHHFLTAERRPATDSAPPSRPPSTDDRRETEPETPQPAVARTTEPPAAATLADLPAVAFGPPSIPAVPPMPASPSPVPASSALRHSAASPSLPAPAPLPGSQSVTASPSVTASQPLPASPSVRASHTVPTSPACSRLASASTFPASRAVPTPRSHPSSPATPASPSVRASSASSASFASMTESAEPAHPAEPAVSSGPADPAGTAGPAGTADGSAPERVWSAVPAIALGLIAAVVTAGQIQASATESRLLGDAARRADLVAAVSTGGLVRRTFVTFGEQNGLLLGQRAAELRRAGADPARAAADDAAGVRIRQLAADMGAQPRDADGVDATTRLIVSGLSGEAVAARSEQDRAAAAAGEAGLRSDRLVVVLFALTLSASLIEIGRSMRGARPGRAVRLAGGLVAGAAVLCAAVVVAFT